MSLNDLRRWWLNARSLGKVSIGKKAKIERGAVINLRHGGSLHTGVGFRIRSGAMIIPYGGSITIGDNFSINPYSILYGHGGLTIGDNVRIAAGCVVIPANHAIEDRSRPIRLQGLSKVGIRIGDDVWIGANVTVLDGASIAKGCVIAAGSVLRGETEPYGIYAGVPARKIRFRQSDPERQGKLE